MAGDAGGIQRCLYRDELQYDLSAATVPVSGWRGHAVTRDRRTDLNGDLEDRLPDRAASREGRVRVFGEEHRERTRRHREPRRGTHAEERNVLRLVITARGRAAVSERQPADLLVPFHRVLDVDVAAMRF